MRHRLSLPLSLAAAAAFVSGCAEQSGPTSPVAADAGLALARQSAGVTLTASATASGFSEARTDYAWSLDKQIRSVMDHDMNPLPGLSGRYVETLIPPGSVNWVDYTYVVTRTARPAVNVDGVRGEVCVTNSGSTSTQGLAITNVVQGPNSAGQLADLVSRVVSVAAKPVLAAGQRYCYPYETSFAGATSATYRSVLRVTVTNYAGQAGSAVGPAGVSSSFTIPARAAVETNATAVLMDGVNAPCAAAFPMIICQGAEGFRPRTFSASEVWQRQTTVDTYNFHVCGENFRFVNGATLTESGPYAPGEQPRTHSSSTTMLIKTGDCAPKPANPGCTYTQGYWKNHAWPEHPIWKPSTLATWPDINGWGFFDSGIEWPDVLNVQPRGDAYFILAHQYIAAVLNQQNGAYVPEQVRQVLVSAYNYFSSSPAVRATYDRTQLTTWAGLLDRYNNGQLGVPHCG